MTTPMKKFSTQANPDLLQEIKSLAKEEGKQFQTLVDEAFRDLIEKKKLKKPRNHVMSHFHKSMDEYNSLYEKLAE